MPGDSGHLFSIVGGSRDGSGDMSTVEVTVHGIIILVAEVPAVNVIDVSVSIIIPSVAGNLTRVSPEVTLKVRMGIIDPCIDHSHDYRWSVFANFPGFRSLNLW